MNLKISVFLIVIFTLFSAIAIAQTGFGQVQVLSPWSIDSSGLVTLNLENRVGGAISINSINFTIDSATYICDVNPDVSIAAGSEATIKCIISGLNKSAGSSYVATTSIYYNYASVEFSSTGTLSGVIEEGTRGFGQVTVVSPWDFSYDGTLKLKLENRVGGTINIKNIYSSIDNRIGAICAVNISIPSGDRSDFIICETNLTGTSGSNYNILVSIEYELTSQQGLYFNSTGTISGTRSYESIFTSLYTDNYENYEGENVLIYFKNYDLKKHVTISLIKIKAENFDVVYGPLTSLLLISPNSTQQILVWNQKDNNGKQVPLGTYWVHAEFSTENRNYTSEYSFKIISKPETSCETDDNCMWCGSECVKKDPDRVCILITPPEGYDCKCDQNICRAIGKTETAVTPATQPTTTAPPQSAQIDKTVLVTILIQIETLKTKFDGLKSASLGILNYYASINDTQNSKKWNDVVNLFSSGITNLDDIKEYIRNVKEQPSQADIVQIKEKIRSVMVIIDSIVDVILNG